jgi:hypothetical protein
MECHIFVNILTKFQVYKTGDELVAIDPLAQNLTYVLTPCALHIVI